MGRAGFRRTRRRSTSSLSATGEAYRLVVVRAIAATVGITVAAITVTIAVARTELPCAHHAPPSENREAVRTTTRARMQTRGEKKDPASLVRDRAFQRYSGPRLRDQQTQEQPWPTAR